MLKTFSGRKASQNEWELMSFIQLLKDRGVRKYAEIGAREGDSFHEILSNLPSDAMGLAIDLPGGLWGKSTTGRKLEHAVKDLSRSGRLVSCKLGDSTTQDVIRWVERFGPYDAMLIDGDHTYQGVLKDWQNYGHMASLVAFHDIVGEGQKENVTHRGVEVPRLWAEIKASGVKTVEFVAPGSSMGIGCVLRD